MITSSTAHNNFTPRHTPPYASLPPCQINECANIGVHHKPLSDGDITKSKAPHPIYGSVLSVNIRDFSIFSSHLTGEELIEFTNVFFDQTYKPIHQQHGWVVRFFDDEITAMFEPGAGQPDDHAERALKVALLIVLAAESFRKWITQRFPKRKLPEFSVGIGIHSGEATICNTSNGAAMETNLTGDMVDIAAHLHAMTKTLGWSIATSSTCTDIVGDRFQINRDNMIILKGKKLPFQAIEITGLNPQKATTRNDIFFTRN